VASIKSLSRARKRAIQFDSQPRHRNETVSFQIWITFIFTSSLILIIPGPVIILLVSQAVKHGRKSVVPLVTGVILGDFTAMTLSLLGLGAIMTASAALFTLFKWIGAIYLVYLGIRLWRTNPEIGSTKNDNKDASSHTLFKSAYIVTALNPKGIAFFVAFLPQFVSPQGPASAQILILGGTFLFLSLVNASMYTLFAGQLREAIKRTGVQKWFNRCGGTAVIGAGIFTAGIHHSV